jgi:hypothetical protein
LQGAYATAYFQAVDVWQHQVQNYQVNAWRTLGRLTQSIQTAEPVAYALNTEIIELQILRHHGRQAGVILDHQQVFFHAFSLVVRALFGVHDAPSLGKVA